MSKIVFVETAEQLVNEIGSNRTLVLVNENYDLTNIIMEYDKNIFYRDEYDGKELVIKNVDNLKIISDKKDKKALITIQPSYATVFNFYNVKNILLENVILGHYPEEGECSGGVLFIENSMNFEIKNSVLFGCGTFGISANEVENLSFINSKITKCNENIMSLNECINCDFIDSEFCNNKTYLFYLSHCYAITYEDCKIQKNIFDKEYYDNYNEYISKFCFNLSDSTRKINLLNCNFDFKKEYITNEPEFTNITKCKTQNNNIFEIK